MSAVVEALPVAIFSGSSSSRFVEESSPRAVLTAFLASATETPEAFETWSIRVVSGLTTSEPAGAVSVPLNGLPVEMSVPPLETIGPK